MYTVPESLGLMTEPSNGYWYYTLWRQAQTVTRARLRSL